MTYSKPLHTSPGACFSLGLTAFPGKGRRRFAPSVLALAISGALAMPGVALASDWVGTTNDWFTGSNWTTPAGVPTNASNVFIDTTAPNFTMVNAGNADAQTVTVGNAAGSNGNLVILNGGTLNNVVGTIGNAGNAAGLVTVTGNGSTWTNTSDLSIGESGSGTLNITNGGSVTNAFGLVGDQAGSSGSVFVDKANWTNTADLLVGVGGAGTLTVQNGGTVSSGDGSVAAFPNTVGIVTVTGVGSAWTNSGNLFVGNGGNGTLAIVAGGVVSNVNGHVGVGANASGTVTVDGPGSTWTHAGNLFIGEGGTGSLDITNGGVVTNAAASVGVDAGSTGTVNVGGTNSSWTSTGQLFVGESGNGTLAISGGGVVGNANGFVGVQTGSTGLVTVDGAGSAWNNAQGLIIGDAGNGTLAVTNGGTVNSVDTLLARFAGATGTVTVDGATSVWTNTGDLNVGSGGTGTLSVLNGGTVNIGNDGSIGGLAGSSGTVAVSGAGSTLDFAGDLLVGSSGAGTLAISAGGKVSNGFGILGMQVGATGAVTVDGAGSSWTNGGSLIVGFLGNGSLAITNGGVVATNFSSIASAVGTTGVVTITGLGSSLTSVSSLVVGEQGTGSLAISQGGAVNSVGGVVGTAGTGTVSVDGVGSTWANGGDLFVGLGGTGTLAITNGGVVGSVAGSIGDQAGATGSVTVDGAGSTWTNTNNLAVGSNGTGSLAISNGGKVMASSISVGSYTGASGHIVVDGTGSSVTGAARIYVGDNGTGTMAVTNGGTVTTGGGHIGFNGIGTVTVDGAGSLWNPGSLTIGVFGGTGTLTVANGGSVAGGLVDIAFQAGSVGTLNIGGAAGAAPVAPGTFTASSIQFGGGDGTINFNHTDTSGNYRFDAAIGGQGSSSVINQNAGWTQLTADSSGFTGLTNVNGGRLAVNGSLANSFVSVNGGGTLGGNGTVGSVHAYAGGVIAPGNSIGTLNVNGGVVFHAGSIYQVEVNPAGQSDQLLASGTATLNGGTVQVLAGAGNYGASTDYTILTAQGGVTGTFAGATSSMVFLDPTLSYDPKNVYLKLTRNANSFASIAQTSNQKAAATGAEALGTGNAVFDAMLKLSAPQARNAFDQVSGEVHASARSVQLEDSHFTRDASLERLRVMDSERVANDGGADAEEGKQARLLPSLRDLAYWARAMGSWGHVDGDGNAAAVKRDTSGFLMGADTRFGEEGRFGLMGGYSRSAFDASDRSSSGSSENYHFGAYAGSRWGDLALRTGISYSRHDVSTSRAVAFPGFTDSLKADYKANTTQAFAELGYRIPTGLLSRQVGLEAFGNLAHVNVSGDGFTERGGAAALRASGNGSGVTFSTLGLRASNDFAFDGGASLTARGSLGWRAASGDVTPTTNLAFAGGSPFAVAGAPIAKSAAVVEAGLDFKLTNAATLGLSYAGQFGSGLKDHSARVHLNVAF